MDNTYTIRPLEWRQTWTDQLPKFTARTPFATFTVHCLAPGKWIWYYRFHRRDEENEGSCVDEAEGKRICEKEWLRRLTKVLEPVA